MFERDFILRQIEMMVKAIGKIFCLQEAKIEMIDENGAISQSWLLNNQIKALLQEKKICQAEDLMFEFMKENPRFDITLVAEEFYKELAKMDEKELNKYNFSVQEILDGIQSVQDFYNA